LLEAALWAAAFDAAWPDACAFAEGDPAAARFGASGAKRLGILEVGMTQAQIIE
jgi:hypothetical protein